MPGFLQKIKTILNRDNSNSQESEDPIPEHLETISNPIKDPVVEILNNIKDLIDITVREIMVPRVDVDALKSTDGFKEALNLITESGYSRIPVYEETIDNIIGILYAKDLVKLISHYVNGHEDNVIRFPDIKIKELVRPAYFVPDGMHVSTLLKEFQEKKLHMAIVVDEYGGVFGLVTLEDIIEEIVGDIQDEYDEEGIMIEKLTDNQYLINARTSIDELNEKLRINLPEDKSDTIGGFVYHLFGEVPKDGDSINFSNFEFVVTGLEGNKIQHIKFTIHPVEPTREDLLGGDNNR